MIENCSSTCSLVNLNWWLRRALACNVATANFESCFARSSCQMNIIICSL